jgi:intein/homing endonuclease
LNASLKIKREFLKALFDDEGTVRSKYVVSLYSINKKGLLQIKGMLEELGIRSKLEKGFGFKRNVYALSINGLKLFRDKIGFGLTRKQQRLEEFLKR